MKHLLIVLALLSTLALPLHAESTDTAAQPAAAATDTTAPAAQDKSHSATIKIDLKGDDDGEAFKKSVRDSVAGFVERVLSSRSDLSDKERAEILGSIRDMPIAEHHGGSDSPGELVIAGLAIIFVFGTPIMIVAAVLYWAYRRRRLAHDTINQFLQSGKDIPPAVLDNLFQEQTPRNNLQKGLVMTGLGVGIFLCFTLIGSMSAASLGLIPLFIGLAQLLIWKLEQNKGAEQE